MIPNWVAMFEYSKAHYKSKPLSRNFKMATSERNRPTTHCKSLSIEYVMYVYGLCLFYLILRPEISIWRLFFAILSPNGDLMILLISSPSSQRYKRCDYGNCIPCETKIPFFSCWGNGKESGHSFISPCHNFLLTLKKESKKEML